MENVREKIIAWLIDEDHEVKSDTPPKGAPIDWILKVTAKVPPVIARIVIQQPSNKRDRIIATLGVVVSPQHREKLMSLTPGERQEIVYRILNMAYQICSECVIMVQPSFIDPQSIVITEVIYHEELSRPRITASIRKLANLLGIISAGFNAYLHLVPEKSKEEGGHPPSFI